MVLICENFLNNQLGGNLPNKLTNSSHLTISGLGYKTAVCQFQIRTRSILSPKNIISAKLVYKIHAFPHQYNIICIPRKGWNCRTALILPFQRKSRKCKGGQRQEWGITKNKQLAKTTPVMGQARLILLA